MTKGLTTLQSEQFLKKYGPNIIKEQKEEPILLKFFEQFNNFLAVLLIFAAVISIIIGEFTDGILIIGIVFLNAFFSLYQESKAEKTLEKLKKMTVTKVRVIRDGIEKEIDSIFLVPGDLIFIEEGAKIPSDAKLIKVVNLEVNEASLSGESLPVQKARSDRVYMGTIVSRGRAYALVTETGPNTKFGKIASELEGIQKEKTPLQKKLESLTKLIGIIGLGSAVMVFMASFNLGLNYFSAFLLAVSLAVAVVPEGLPAVLTITLAIGVHEMGKKKSIIRRLSAIEALGSITLIATDKTGTLTTNQMRIKEIYVNDKVYGEARLPAPSDGLFNKLLLDGVLCSTASLVYTHDQREADVLGDPTEGAVLILANKLGFLPEKIKAEWEIIEESPFDSRTKMMTIQVKKGKNIFEFAKGAPESIFKIVKFSASKFKKAEKQLDLWTKKGLRVLAFAEKDTFLGMVAIHDPARPEAQDAIRQARQAGIKVVMITGDNEKTAEAIGISCGLIQKGDEVMTGEQLDEHTDEELLGHLRRIRVFARTTPWHKTRIVKLYQELGEIVAVTGDGVNDVIALKQADVGIAMGLVGTDVARETADMIITDDNFASIVTAIEEGRNIIKKLKNSIKYLLSCNIAEALALIVGLLIGVPHIFLPIQLLYINLITDGFPALALAFSARDESVMRQPPTKTLTLLNPFDKDYILSVGIFSAFIVVYSYFLFSGVDGLRGKTAAFSVLALIQSFIFVDLWVSHKWPFSHLKQLKSPVFIGAFIIPFCLQFMILNNAYLNSIFHVNSLPIADFVRFILLSSLVLVWIEIVKKVLPRS